MKQFGIDQNLAPAITSGIVRQLPYAVLPVIEIGDDASRFPQFGNIIALFSSMVPG